MGLEALMARDHQLMPRRCRRYQRLRSSELCDEDQVARARRGPLRLRRKKKAVLFRMAAAAPRKRVARLVLMRLVLLAPARRAAALLAELVRRIATAAAAASAMAECPAAAGIVFSSQWGLPVLSHSPSSSRTARLRSFYLDRSLSSGSGSGAGSPC